MQEGNTEYIGYGIHCSSSEQLRSYNIHISLSSPRFQPWDDRPAILLFKGTIVQRSRYVDLRQNYLIIPMSRMGTKPVHTHWNLPSLGLCRGRGGRLDRRSCL
jgi:hypothetical protein